MNRKRDLANFFIFVKGPDMALVDPDFAEELKSYGADTALECFNCGTCAAICPLLYEHFPRKMIRYVQVGAQRNPAKGTGTLEAPDAAACAPGPVPARPTPVNSSWGCAATPLRCPAPFSAFGRGEASRVPPQLPQAKRLPP